MKAPNEKKNVNNTNIIFCKGLFSFEKMKREEKVTFTPHRFLFSKPNF